MKWTIDRLGARANGTRLAILVDDDGDDVGSVTATDEQLDDLEARLREATLRALRDGVATAFGSPVGCGALTDDELVRQVRLLREQANRRYAADTWRAARKRAAADLPVSEATLVEWEGGVADGHPRRVIAWCVRQIVAMKAAGS